MSKEDYAMKDCSSKGLVMPGLSSESLTENLRRGAKDLLAQAIQVDVADYTDSHKVQLDEDGRRLVVRAGSLPEREIQTSLGQIGVKQARIDDRRLDDNGERMGFKSSILPSYLRRYKAMEELLPWLYLKGISSGDFSHALSSILGKNAPGLSSSTITRLKETTIVIIFHKVGNKSHRLGGRTRSPWPDGLFVVSHRP